MPYTEWHRVNTIELTTTFPWDSPQVRERMFSNLNEFMHIGQSRSYVGMSILSRKSSECGQGKRGHDHVNERVSWFWRVVRDQPLGLCLRLLELRIFQGRSKWLCSRHHQGYGAA